MVTQGVSGNYANLQRGGAAEAATVKAGKDYRLQKTFGPKRQESRLHIRQSLTRLRKRKSLRIRECKPFAEKGFGQFKVLC